MEQGCVHIYTGDGKGKTTAACGLAVRAAGCGQRVWFAQFLKDGSSGEAVILRSLPGVMVAPCLEHVKFTIAMDENDRREAHGFYSSLLKQAEEAACSGAYGLVVLDEVIPAAALGFVAEQDLLRLLRTSGRRSEIVLTGRDPSPALIGAADYVSRIEKVKHPYDRGLAARRGVEW